MPAQELLLRVDRLDGEELLLDGLGLATAFFGTEADESSFGKPRVTYGGLHDYEAVQNQRKLDLVESLLEVAGEAGISLTHLAMAFVLEHPAVTSAIIGPRTMDQMTDLLAGADVRLEQAVLDRIDELVPPGTNVNEADSGWVAPGLSRSQRRRR